MKRSSKIILLLAAVMAFSVLLAGCGLFDSGKGGGNNTPGTYTIQYTDDAGPHTLTVTEGMPYSLESVPYRYGYEFLGLFDAETGGTQYVGANGSSLAPYADKENKVLFPQFKAIDYTVILDYQGGSVTGDRSLTAAYGSTLPELPKNVTLAHNEFRGWYTKENRNGTQIADEYGLLPVVSVLNETNFVLDDTNRRVTLYAGFELEKHTVTFHFDAGLPEEEVKVPYNTPIGEVVPKTRNGSGEAGLVWSKSPNDTGKTNVFDGKVTEEMDLYIVEWAPVIELNVNGGDEVTPVVARAGSAISLPTPTKALAKFLYWENASGQQADITIMPSTSTTLKAIWQAKIEFDENGGEDVNDISEKAGTSITLPTPTREGYIFAGWYTSDKEKYERTTMPSAGIALKAGWYKQKAASKVLVDSNSSVQSTSHKETFMDKLTLNFSEYLAADFNGLIEVTVKWKQKNTDASQNYSKSVAVGFYTQRTVSDDYRIARVVYKHTHSSYENMEKTFTVQLSGNKIYVTLASDSNATGWLYNGYVTDFRYELSYPDTTYLFL